MSFLISLGQFLGKILKEILPGLLKQFRKPKDVKIAGYDKDLKKDIDDSIEYDLGKPYGEDDA